MVPQEPAAKVRCSDVLRSAGQLGTRFAEDQRVKKLQLGCDVVGQVAEVVSDLESASSVFGDDCVHHLLGERRIPVAEPSRFGVVVAPADTKLGYVYDVRSGAPGMTRDGKPFGRALAGMSRRVRHRGFTYVGVLIAVAVIGVALAGVGQLWSVQAQRERERELLFIGEQYRVALARYVAATPPGKARYPRTLDELVEDRRHIVIRRHLRQVYPDPFTSAVEWEVVSAPDGGIAAVHSRHDGKPMKIGNFPPRFAKFEEAKTYRDWVFGAPPPRIGAIAR